MSYQVLTGGVRSGKSACAEQLAGQNARVLYVATGAIWDAEMAVRIQRHRDRRPPHWGLLEAGEGLLASIRTVVEKNDPAWDGLLIDCLSTWVSRILMNLPEAEWRAEATRARMLSEAEALADWLVGWEGRAVVVTSETGLGGVAMTPLGRAFGDLLGEVNQIVARQAQDMWLVVSGRPLRLPPAPDWMSAGGQPT